MKKKCNSINLILFLDFVKMTQFYSPYKKKEKSNYDKKISENIFLTFKRINFISRTSKRKPANRR